MPSELRRPLFSLLNAVIAASSASASLSCPRHRRLDPEVEALGRLDLREQRGGVAVLGELHHRALERLERGSRRLPDRGRCDTEIERRRGNRNPRPQQRRLALDEVQPVVA